MPRKEPAGEHSRPSGHRHALQLDPRAERQAGRAEGAPGPDTSQPVLSVPSWPER
jgi:hypothetical protein